MVRQHGKSEIEEANQGKKVALCMEDGKKVVVMIKEESEAEQGMRGKEEMQSERHALYSIRTTGRTFRTQGSPRVRNGTELDNRLERLGEGVEVVSVCEEARSANAPTQFTCYIDEFHKLA